MSKLLYRTAILLAAAAALGVVAVWFSPAVQDRLLRAATQRAVQGPSAFDAFDGLRVFMCGTASPLPAPGRAQACVAVQAGSDIYVVDVGAGSVQVMTVAGVPLERIGTVLLTHFHSDHIAALPDLNLNSWVAGRPQPLSVVGPEGVETVVAGMNTAYRLDRGYRVAHHGSVLLPPALGVMVARELAPGDGLEFGELRISSFAVDHAPVAPAVGYRFDYRGRSVVISGDTNATPALAEAARGADLLLADALSLPIVSALEAAAAGTRMGKVLSDIQDYHAHAADLGPLAAEAGVRQLAVYHLVPAPTNAILERVFRRELPADAVVTREGMRFELPAGSRTIVHIES